MFDKKYKDAIDDITPSDEAFAKTLSAMNTANRALPRRRSVLRIALISIFVVILACLTLVAAFHNGNDQNVSMPPIEEIISTENSVSAEASKHESDNETTESYVSEVCNNSETESEQDVLSAYVGEEEISEDTNSEQENIQSEEESIADEITSEVISDEPFVSNEPVISDEPQESQKPDEPEVSNVPEENISNENIGIGDMTSVNSFISYEEIFDALKEIENNRYENEYIGPDTDEAPDSPETDDNVSSPEQNESGNNNNNSNNIPDYSGTNNQVQNVEESDIVKTDGKYIYHCQYAGSSLYISEVNDGNIKQVRYININEGGSNTIGEILLFGNKMAIIYDTYDNGNYTVCSIYDITDRTKPQKIRDLKQDGIFNSARSIGDKIYIISNHFCFFTTNDFETMNIEKMPKVNGKVLSPTEIYVSEDENSFSSIIIATAYDINSNSDDFQSKIALIGFSYEAYISESSIYLNSICSHYTPDSIQEGKKEVTSYTNIYRISLNDGNLEYTASATIPGTVSRQFWMDEKDGTLRVAANIGISRIYYDLENATDDYVPYIYNTEPDINRVYVLNENMKIIGTSDDLGVGEQIKSVRYIGDIAYVVTFLTVDPIYAIDLSDPTNPTTLSKLKINGFSTYMHPYKNEYMIGIGFDADPTNGAQRGLKLTMFDISDPEQLKEISTVNYTYDWAKGAISPATDEHKTVLIDSDKEIIAIPIIFTVYENISETEYVPHDYLHYVFYEFSNGIFKEKASVRICERFYEENSKLRGMYIGDYCYVVTQRGITSISLSTYEIVDEIGYLRFNEDDYAN